jgi:hypothetical protein
VDAIFLTPHIVPAPPIKELRPGILLCREELRPERNPCAIATGAGKSNGPQQKISRVTRIAIA